MGLNRYFSKEDMKMANKHIKMCLTSTAMRETQIKIKFYYFTSRMPKSKEQTIANTGKQAEKLEPLYL